MRARLAVWLLLAASSAQAAGVHYEAFPRSDLFPLLLADPRQIQISASYYRLAGKDISDLALGHSWGMARWHSPQEAWTWQWDVEAMAISRFEVAGAVNEFQTIDFFANLPLEARHGKCSGKFMLFHESSHLGDDFIRRTGDSGFRYSIDGLRATLALEPFEFLRLYGGGTYLLHTVPAPERGAFQAGFELTSRELGLFKNYPTHAYLAQDLQSHQNVRWNLNSRSVLGLRVGFKKALRSMRFHAGYFDGHSPYGQFFAKREHYADIGISFDF